MSYRSSLIWVYTFSTRSFLNIWAYDKSRQHLVVIGALRVSRALTPLFGNGAGAHGIGKISGVLTEIGKFDIILR